MPKIRITTKMDLIKIYEAGKLEELEAWLKERDEKNLEFVKLLRHFHSYFWELEEECKKSGYYPDLKIRKDLDRSKIYDDPLFPAFKDYAEKYLGAINSRLLRFPEELIPDEIGKEFYKKYLCRGLKKFGFKTTLAEATKYGEPRIIEIINRY